VTEPLSRAPFAAKLASAIPDIGTASLFAWCWTNPVAWRPELASVLGQLMLMEFLVVHSSPFVGGLMASDARPARKLAGGLFLTAVYMFFAAGFTLSQGSWWPFAGFFWLLLSRGATALASRHAGLAAGRRMLFYWFGGFALYLLSGLAVRELPLPAMAWGLIYFGVHALVKLLERPEWFTRADDEPVTS
jgi:hypothetical protein